MKWRLFNATRSTFLAAFADLSADGIEAMVDEDVIAMRHEKQQVHPNTGA